MKRFIALCFIIFMTIQFAGCTEKKNAALKAIVDTKEIHREQIVESISSTGRIIAEYYVDVVARVDGYLEKKFFEEGSKVKKGDLLFQIEPNTYAAKVNEASANLRNAQASLVDSSKNLQRAAQLVKEDFISKSDYDKNLALRDKDRASVDSAKAALTQARINYGYTHIHSPINGKIGRIFITEGNYVTPQSGTLAKIVSLDPIQMDFSLKSKDYLLLKKASKVDDLSDISVEIKLADDSIYPKKGKIQFIDNTVDVSSGSVVVRTIFDNKDSLLVPGDFVQVKVTLNKPENVILVPQDAVLQTEDGKYLYVIDENKKAHKRDIVAEDEYNKNWIVTSGLNEGEVIAITGLQYIQEGQQVVLNKDKKAEKAQNSEIQEVGKPSFAKKVFRKIKNLLKKLIGK